MMQLDRLDVARPMVILAVQRSGSTLLKTLLCSHPEVFVAAHSDLLWEMIDKEMTQERLANKLAYELQHEETYRTWEHLHRFIQETALRFWFSSDEPAKLDKERPSRWGFVFYELDTASLEKLLVVFPQAKLVHIVRDGRNVVASWMSNFEELAHGRPDVRNDPSTLARMWARHLMVAEQAPAHLLRLEDLIAESTRAQTLTSLLDYLELERAPELDAFVKEMPWVNEEKKQHQRWLQDLDELQLGRMTRQKSFADMLRKYGYLA